MNKCINEILVQETKNLYTRIWRNTDKKKFENPCSSLSVYILSGSGLFRVGRS